MTRHPPLYDADARDPGDFPDAVITDCRSYQADIQHQDGSVVKYEIVVPYRDSISAPPSNGLGNSDMKVVAGASSARESADYAYLQTSEISQAIYGAVYRGLLLKRTSTSDGSVQWTTTDKRVAIKRLDYDRVMRDESEGKSSERPMEEIKIMQYLQRHIASVGDHTLDEELTGEAIWARAEYGIREHNIMTSVDILTDNQYLYIVMPFCDGKELFDVIQEQKVSEAEARHYFKQILKAIETLQESGVCHRDISLDNIMVSSSGIITLIEFGMSLKIPYIINKNGNRQRCMIRPGRACGKVRKECVIGFSIV